MENVKVGEVVLVVFAGNELMVVCSALGSSTFSVITSIVLAIQSSA